MLNSYYKGILYDCQDSVLVKLGFCSLRKLIAPNHIIHCSNSYDILEIRFYNYNKTNKMYYKDVRTS